MLFPLEKTSVKLVIVVIETVLSGDSLYPIPYITPRGQKPFRACFSLSFKSKNVHSGHVVCFLDLFRLVLIPK